MTEAEIIRLLKAEVAQTTIPFDEWLHRARLGKYTELQLAASHWYKAGRLAEQLKPAPAPKPAPKPAPAPSPTPLPSGNRCLYFSTVDQDTINWVASLGRGYTALFSADLNLSQIGKPYWVSVAQVQQLTAAGVTVASWCDCSQTPYSAAVELAGRPGFSFAGGQAEDVAQYWQARGLESEPKAKHMIGNPANLLSGALADAIEMTAEGKIAFIGEVLHPDPGYSAQGVNISSACMYVDMDEAQGGYQPLASFDVMPASLKAGASIYTAGRMTAEDRRLYEAWTRP